MFFVGTIVYILLRAFNIISFSWLYVLWPLWLPAILKEMAGWYGTVWPLLHDYECKLSFTFLDTKYEYEKFVR